MATNRVQLIRPEGAISRGWVWAVPLPSPSSTSSGTPYSLHTLLPAQASPVQGLWDSISSTIACYYVPFLILYCVPPKLKSVTSDNFLHMAPHQQQPPPHIPMIFKLFFLYIEPMSALVGAYYSANESQTYLELSHAPTAPTDGIPTSTTIVLNQLSNLYFLFALNEAFVLRATKDVKVWCALLFCLLIADVGHLFSVRALGRQIYWDVASWNAIDWGNIGFVYLGAVMRISFLYLAWSTSESRTRPRRRSTRARTVKKM